MWIEVVLSTGLTDCGKRTLRFSLEEGLTPAVVADRLQIPREAIGLIAVNGRVADWMEPLLPNQRVCFFPFLMGG